MTMDELLAAATAAGMTFRDMTAEERRARGSSANCALFRDGVIVAAYCFPPRWDHRYRAMTQQCIDLVADDIRRIVVRDSVVVSE